MGMRLFVVLVCAHILGDFLFQTKKMAQNKNRVSVLFLHSAIHGILVYFLVAQLQLWSLVLLVFVVHAVVDFVKQKNQETLRVFVIDQAVHIGFLWVFAFIFYRNEMVVRTDAFYSGLVLISGFVAVVLGSGIVVEKMAKGLIEKNKLEVGGLDGGGRLIGQLERALIFLFVLIGQPAGIGFLVAAKSILRFQEAKKQVLAEYVLIGTLLSFGLAMALSVVTLKALCF